MGLNRVRGALRRPTTLLRRAVSEFFADGCTQRAAAISYFTLFSLFPLAILSVAVVGLVVDDDAARGRVITLVLDAVPLGAGRRELDEILRTVTAQVEGFGLVGLGGLLIAASFAMTLALRVVGSLGSELARLGQLGELASGTLGWLAQLAPAVLTFAVVAGLFRVVPASDTRLRDVWPGALLVAVGFELAKTAFAFYIANIADYGAIYGSLATVMAFLFFVFVAANVFLLGAEVASEWPAVRDAPATREGGERGSPPR
jgi:membrane protein